MKRVICFIFKHKSAKKLQAHGEYETHICKRCLAVYARKR